MNPWTVFVEWIASSVGAVGAALGFGPRVGILVTAFLVRAALIPVMAPLAERTKERQRVVRRLRPRIKELDRELRDDPGTLHRRLKELHEENGIGLVDWAGLGAALVQLPLLIALFQAVLLLWEPAALTLGGASWGALAGLLSWLATHLTGQAEDARWMLWLSAALPLAICLWLGTGIGLYLLGFYGAGVLQGAISVQRRRRSAAA